MHLKTLSDIDDVTTTPPCNYIPATIYAFVLFVFFLNLYDIRWNCFLTDRRIEKNTQ